MGDGFLQQRPAAELFDEFISSSTCRAALWTFSQLCEHLQLDRHRAERPLYRSIKCCLKYWRADALWAKLERRAAHQEYQQGGACRNATVRVLTLTRPSSVMPGRLCTFSRFCQNWEGCPLLEQNFGRTMDADGRFSLSDWLVCDHRGGAVWSQDSS